MPSTALRSSTMPSRGADHCTVTGATFDFSIAAMTGSGTSRFVSRCREPRPYTSTPPTSFELIVARYSAAADATAEL